MNDVYWMKKMNLTEKEKELLAIDEVFLNHTLHHGYNVGDLSKSELGVFFLKTLLNNGFYDYLKSSYESQQFSKANIIAYTNMNTCLHKLAQSNEIKLFIDEYGYDEFVEMFDTLVSTLLEKKRFTKLNQISEFQNPFAILASFVLIAKDEKHFTSEHDNIETYKQIVFSW